MQAAAQNVGGGHGRQAGMHGRRRGEPQADASALCPPVKLAWEEQQLCLHWLTLAGCSLMARSDIELDNPDGCRHSCWVHDCWLHSCQA